MTAYAETYLMRGAKWGIEDHKDGRPPALHFFHDEFLIGRRKRFVLWRNGGGFGQADSLEEARCKLIAYARQQAEADRERALQTVAECDEVLGALNPDPLALFRMTGDGAQPV